MNAKESVAMYCKAQAEINRIDKCNEDQKKTLTERIKTCRSILTDELTQKQISCIEVCDESYSDPVYFRLKSSNTTTNISIEDVVQVLQSLDKIVLNECAEKFQHDLPKMVSHTIQNYVRNKKKEDDKMTLSISNNRERGYTRDINHNISNETIQIAKDLLLAKKELGSLKQSHSEQKKTAIQTQKEVETQVKNALKNSDPDNMTTRVHMMQQDNEWIYYLRCKEHEKQVPFGIRKMIPMVENAVLKLLEEYGYSREYSSCQQLDNQFWKTLSTRVSDIHAAQADEKKIISKLSLDRGAPRNKRKIS